VHTPHPRIARPERFILSAQPPILCNVDRPIIMPYLGRNPTVFFRVQDEYSQAQYCEHRGILSKNQSNASFNPRLSKTRQTIQDHLNWASRKSSTFISVYSDWATANREARRRLADGHANVVIWKIDTLKGHRKAQYRNIRLLALRCRIWVPDKAWNNSEHEWLFLHQVPESMIVRYLVLFAKYIVNFLADLQQAVHSSSSLLSSRCNAVISAVVIVAPVPVEEMFTSRHSFFGLRLHSVDRYSSRRVERANGIEPVSTVSSGEHRAAFQHRWITHTR
jgi:hypothetical protein